MRFKEGLAKLFSRDSGKVTPNMASLDTQRRQAAQRGREERVFGKDTVEASKKVRVVDPDEIHTAAAKGKQRDGERAPVGKYPDTPTSYRVSKNLADASAEQIEAQMRKVVEAAEKGDKAA